jgi:uncharacterized protein (TIGR02271 family)
MKTCNNHTTCVMRVFKVGTALGVAIFTTFALEAQNHPYNPVEPSGVTLPSGVSQPAGLALPLGATQTPAPLAVYPPSLPMGTPPEPGATSTRLAQEFPKEAVRGNQTGIALADIPVETSGQADIPLHKEQMVVGKRDVSNGGVLIRTVVHTENVSQPVDLRREEYVIERVPASEAPERDETANGAIVFHGQEIYIPLTREEPVASKRAVLVERVQLGKRIETDHQTVSSPVRSEDVEITKVSGKAAGNYWQEAAPVAAASPGDANSVNLLREEMVVDKKVVDNGGVKLQKVVQTQVASQAVDLRREEYTIDRSPVINPQVADADFSQKEIRLNLSREEPVVSTRIEPTEWVRVRKQVHTDTQTVSGIVRTENIEIVKLPGSQPAMGGTSASGQSGTTVISGSGTSK